MKSSLKNTLGVTVGIFCLMCWAQFAAAQSGNRTGGYQPQQVIPQQQFSGAVETYVPPSQSVPFASQPAQTSRLGFDQYDHQALDSLLQKYVDQNGDVDYTTWKSNQQDRATLMNYLRGMNSVDASVPSSTQSQMAFWINAYNALTIEGILQLFPTRSIKDHAPNANGYNIWDDFKMPVGGTEYSLNDIEHKVLRKMGDPRIHFAIVCASKSCPQLAQRAYFGSSLEQQLANSSRLFFHTPSKFTYDLQRGQLGLSKIIQWFGDDFGRNDQERLRYLSQFMPADAARLANSGSAAISYLEYDWGLNLAPVRSLTGGQNIGSVQTLRPQGSATRQPVPSQTLPPQGSATRQPVPGQFVSPQGSATRQPVPGQFVSPQGSATRQQYQGQLYQGQQFQGQQFQNFAPIQQPPGCINSGCPSQSGYGYGYGY